MWKMTEINVNDIVKLLNHYDQWLNYCHMNWNSINIETRYDKILTDYQTIILYDCW